MNEIKKYNIFILITTIIKSMIELFIPIILYNKGLDLKYIIIFYLIKYIFLLIFSNTIKKFKLNNKVIIYLSSFISIITYILLTFKYSSFIYLIIVSSLYSFYLSTYWLYRHNTALSLIENKKTTERSSGFMILTLVGIIPSSLLGGYLINNFKTIYLIIIICVLTIISLFFINSSVIKRDREKIKIPFNNRLFLFLEQFKFIALSLFPLFTYNTILNSYTYVGLLNALTSVVSIISIFLLSKKMDKNKKDYLNIICVLLGVSWIFKLIFKDAGFFLVITLFEGIFRYSLDTIVLRNIYSYGKKLNKLSYNVYIENIRNISRVLISVILVVLNVNINVIIILGIISLFISYFIKFDDGQYGYHSSK